jgi:enoyl-CoA hydratase/carnithine racemase
MNPPPHSGRVTTERRGSVVHVTLSHPGRRNAITVAMWRELAALFTGFSRDDSLRAVLIRGADGHFSAGADITEFPRERADADSVYHFHQHIIAPALDAIGGCAVPVVAAIEGACVGGGLEIACECDLRIAAASAQFGAPIRQLGFPMAPRELRGVLAVAGRSVALELLLEARTLNATAAAAKGLVTRVVPDAELEAEANLTADNLAAGPALVARLNKQTIRRLAPPAGDFTEAELRAFYAAWSASPDHREGVQAFLERRPPRFG